MSADPLVLFVKLLFPDPVVPESDCLSGCRPIAATAFELCCLERGLVQWSEVVVGVDVD